MHRLEWNSALLTMPLTSGVGISMPAFEPEEDNKNIHYDIN